VSDVALASLKGKARRCGLKKKGKKKGINVHRPARIALRVDLIPKEYLPDLTTKDNRELMFSALFLTFLFAMGAIFYMLR
jgi:hypothetical protein